MNMSFEMCEPADVIPALRGVDRVDESIAVNDIRGGTHEKLPMAHSHWGM